MDGFVHIRKAHCMFGWDWGAHLPDAGIYRPVSLLAVKTGRLDSVRIHQEHQQDQVDLHLEVTWNPAENLRTEIPAAAAEKDAGDISVSYGRHCDSPRWH